MDETHVAAVPVVRLCRPEAEEELPAVGPAVPLDEVQTRDDAAAAEPVALQASSAAVDERNDALVRTSPGREDHPLEARVAIEVPVMGSLAEG